MVSVKIVRRSCHSRQAMKEVNTSYKEWKVWQTVLVSVKIVRRSCPSRQGMREVNTSYKEWKVWQTVLVSVEIVRTSCPSRQGMREVKCFPLNTRNIPGPVSWRLGIYKILWKKSRTSCRSGRGSPSFIHQVIIITWLNKLCDCMLSYWRWL